MGSCSCCGGCNPALNQLERMVNDILATRVPDLQALILEANTAIAEMHQLIEDNTQWVNNHDVIEGDIITLPVTNRDITLNLIGTVPLNMVTVNLPTNVDGRVGQRIFVNSNIQIANAKFQSTNPVNNAEIMFAVGDNVVYYRNQPTIWSRITS